MKTLRVILISIVLFTACIPTNLASNATQTSTNENIIKPTNNITSSATPEVIYQPLTATSGFQLEEAKAEVLELLKNNNGCKLPCFWGITPGKTPWNEANDFVRRLSSQYSAESTLEENSFFYNSYFLPANDIYGPSDLHIELGILNGIVHTISISDFDIPNYYLSEFLLDNGKPDEVWVFTNSVNPTGIDKIGFLVSLYYEKQQMIVTYGRGQATIGDEWLNGCIMYSPSLKIWAWDESLNIPETAFSNLDEIQTGWKNISDATQGAMNPEKFYQSFSDHNTELCFQTPKKIWSEP